MSEHRHDCPLCDGYFMCDECDDDGPNTTPCMECKLHASMVRAEKAESNLRRAAALIIRHPEGDAVTQGSYNALRSRLADAEKAEALAARYRAALLLIAPEPPAGDRQSPAGHDDPWRVAEEALLAEETTWDA